MLQHRYAFYIGIFALVLAVFGQALWFNFAPSDDLFLVVQNLAVRGPTLTNLKTVFTMYDPELYIPLTFVSYQIDYLIGDLSPFIYHFSNIIIHAINALLVTWLLTLLTDKKKLAMFAGILFAIHPLQTEAVVWIAGRKDLLSTLFYLLSFIFYIRSQKKVSVIFFLCALLSKVNVLTLPIALLLYDSLIDQKRISKKMVIDKIPYFVLSIIFLIIALAGKERVVSVLSNWEMLLLACKSAFFYLWKFIVPLGLTIIYPHNGAVTLGEFLPFLIGVIVLLAIIFVSRKRMSWLTFGLLFYLITLVPTFSNPAKAGFIFFAVDRYAYLPMVGLLFLLVHCIVRFLNIRIYVYPNILICKVIGVFVVLALGALSFHQTKWWEDGESLYTRAVQLYPESVPASTSLARTYRKQREYQRAFDVLLETLKYTDHPTLHLEAGYIYARVGQVADARNEFRKAKDMDPENAEPVFSLGSLEEQIGNTITAKTLFEEAVTLDPSYVIARVRLAYRMIEDNQIEEAKNQLQQALEWNWNSVQAHELYADLLSSEGNHDEASMHRKIASLLRKGGQPFN